MKTRVYIETSVISYLTARPSRDLVGMARQQVTQTWWDVRAKHDLYCEPGDSTADRSPSGRDGPAATLYLYPRRATWSRR